eukprot:scaffold384503_cov15-Prasinocladus_malaysianus.AAC.1
MTRGRSTTPPTGGSAGERRIGSVFSEFLQGATDSVGTANKLGDDHSDGADGTGEPTDERGSDDETDDDDDDDNGIDDDPRGTGKNADGDNGV